MNITVKTLKNWTSERIAVIIQKLELYHFTTDMGPKDSDGMANSLDPHQTSSSLGAV